MAMDISERGLRALGADDLAGTIAEVHKKFRRRYLGMGDIPVSDSPDIITIPPVLREGAIHLPKITTLGRTGDEMVAMLDSVGGELSVSTKVRDIVSRATPAEQGEQTIGLMALNSNVLTRRDPRRFGIRLSTQLALQFGDKVSTEAFIGLAIEIAKGKVQLQRNGETLNAIMDTVPDGFGRPHVLFLIHPESDEVCLSAMEDDHDEQLQPAGDWWVVSNTKFL